jgi:very-short-patch-repair endonuclease
MPEEIRSHIEKFAHEFYTQALNLTLSNPLLRIPQSKRTARFLEFDESHMRLAVQALIDRERSIAFIGEDASERETQAAHNSRRSGAQTTLWLDAPAKHERVEAVLRALAKRHDELIEKRGLPCAYVGIGYLKWIPDDATTTWAPLLLVPVEIDLIQSPALLKTIVTLRVSERDTCENPVLREYLRLKYKLLLPRFDYPSEPNLARITAWLAKVKGITGTKPGWAIEEGGVFGLFDCGAIAADCDVKNWSVPLHERELVQKILLSTHTQDTKPAPAPFMPDALLLPADGSQLQALQHAAAGTSIVLHGPPGSGKSQTIVNLIAQALAADKSVLFVAQKPEAAHVVHRRLAECGLAPFCSLLVPMGDTRNLKGAMLDGLRTREQLVKQNCPELRYERVQLEQHIALLGRYAQALPITIPNLEITAREAVAELAVHSLNKTPTLDREDLVHPTTVQAFHTALRALQSLVRLRGEVADEAFAALGGLRPVGSDVRAHEAAFALIDDLRKIATACQGIRTAIATVQRLGLDRFPMEVAELRSLGESRPPALQLADAALLTRASRLRRPGAKGALRTLEEAQSVLRAVRNEIPDCRALVESTAIPDERTIARIESTLRRFGLQETSIGAVQSQIAQVEQLQRVISAFDCLVSPGPIARALARSDDFGHWQRLVNFLDVLSQPHAGRSFLIERVQSSTQARPPAPALEQVLAAQRQAERVSAVRDRTRAVCLAEQLPNLSELRIAQSAIAARSRLISRTIGVLCDKRYRHARRVAYTALLPGVQRSAWPSALQSCIELVEAERDWTRDAELVGRAAAAVADPARWQQACEWYQKIALLARLAKLSLQTAWELSTAFEACQIREAETEALQAACRIAASDVLSKGLSDLFATRDLTPAALSDALGALAAEMKEAVALGSALRFDGATPFKRVLASATRISELRRAIARIEAEPEARTLAAEDYRGIDTDVAPYQTAREWLDAWSNPRTPFWPSVLDWIFSDTVSVSARGTALLAVIDSLSAHLPALRDPFARVASGFAFGGASQLLKIGNWHTLDQNIHGTGQVLQFESAIHNLFLFGSQAAEAAPLAGHGLIDRALRSEIQVELLPAIYRRGSLEQSLRDFERTAPLLEADRGTLDAALKDLPDLDEKLRASNAKILVKRLMDRAAPPGRSVGPVRDYTERGYIKHLLGLQRPRFEVQDLFRRSRQALRAMQPCVIATPSAASEYLPRDEEVFDLLIMDEASQVTPESAIGSIARAKQAIIVGDPQQLPPTNFFMGAHQSSDGSEDDDAAGVTDVESILERAISALHSVHLTGHYRSRHHSLISFSNKHFYDKRLVTTLSVRPRDSRLGIIAHHIKDGRYAAGTNEQEAIAVANGVMKHLASGSKETLGVVAFNAAQAALIETHIEAAARTSQQAFNDYSRARQGKDPLFIRNLESVQGDERDIIFVSYTYGPDVEKGVVAQRFGPILRDKGERRLNVLVTRARNRVEVFHSLLPNQIVSDSKGAQIMRAYLEYARQTPEFDTTTGEFESDFEEQVARAIESIDQRLLVRPQVGCDGFRIDLGIALRSNPARFILGVECDGATYHSTQHARDRDLIRQTILEQHGWTIHRVWSTAWWKNAPHELARLEKAVREAMSREAARNVPTRQ